MKIVLSAVPLGRDKAKQKKAAHRWLLMNDPKYKDLCEQMDQLYDDDDNPRVEWTAEAGKRAASLFRQIKARLAKRMREAK